MNQETIKSMFISKSGKLNNNYKLLFNKQSQEIQEYVMTLYPEYEDLGDKLKSVIEGNYRPCPVCNSAMSWKDKNKTCSKECAKKSLVENQEKTNLERYGVRNAAQAEVFQQKMQQTNLERYGVTHPLKNKESLEKMQQTNLDRYGVNWVAQNEEVWEKQRETCVERYGTEYAVQNKSIQEKNKQTNLERYGVEYPLQSEKIKETVRQTNLERYGATHHFKNPDIMNKWKETYINSKIEYIKSRMGVEISYEEAKVFPIDISRSYSDEYLNAMLSFIREGLQPNIELLKGEFAENQYRLTAKECGYDFTITTIPELEIMNWLDEFNIEYEAKRRDIIAPYEIDIFIPKHNIAIEFNGSYWHSDLFREKYYHQMKTKLCNEKGITLIHIHEYLFNSKADIFKNIIKSKLQLNDKVYARKCILKKVSTSEEKEFLNKYHLQGYISSSECYGLYYNDELLTLCSFGKPRFNKNYDHELLRNCSKPGTTVVGGLSKIVKHYKKENNVDSVICYSDASISYNKSQSITEPSYVWYKTNIHLSRYQTMKHNLPKLLGNKYDESLSETENMKLAGFNRVYDSGNYITIY